MYKYYSGVSSSSDVDKYINTERPKQPPKVFEKEYSPHQEMIEETQPKEFKEEIKKPHGKDGKFCSLNGISDKSKKIKKNKIEWTEDCELIQVNTPVPINHPKYKKKYFIVIVYKQGGKIKRKTIKFGDKEKDDFIDHKSKERKDKTLSSMKNYHSPFKGNYWRYHLLNKFTDIQKAYMEFIKEHHLF